MSFTSESARRWTWLAFLLFSALVLVLRPALAGWPVLSSAGVVTVSALYVLLPGWVTLRLFAGGEEHALATLMLAWILGQALLACTYLGASLLQLQHLCLFHPLPFLVIALARARRKRESAAVVPSCSDLCACAVLLVLAALRSYCEDKSEWYLFGGDAAFHAGNAAELRWHWPMQDPRLAGEPLRYHFFSYVLPCVQSLTLGTGVRPGLFGTGAALFPMGFALAAFVTARRVGAGTWLAAACVATLLLHVDLGELLHPWIGASLDTDNHLDIGLYSSPTTALGLTFLLGLVYLLHGFLRDSAAIRGRELVLAGFLACGASGSKGSVLPPLFAGVAAAIVIGWLSQREIPKRLIIVLGVSIACALPMTLFLVGGETSYASSMFTVEPFASQRLSAFHSTLTSWLGTDPSQPGLALLIALAPGWTALFLGAGSVGLIAWIVRGRCPRPAFELVLIATAIAGMVPAWLLVAPGQSQLFFAYDSQVCVMLLGAVGLQQALQSRGLGRMLLPAAFSAVLALQALRVGAWMVQHFRAALPPNSAAALGYQEALGWVRDHVPPDAVLLANTLWLGPSTWTERHIFFETSAFSARAHAGWRPPWQRTAEPVTAPFAERELLQQRFLLDPDARTLDQIRAELPASIPLYVLRDDVHLGLPGRRNAVQFRAFDAHTPWGSSVGAELVHSTPWLEVYRLPEPRR